MTRCQQVEYLGDATRDYLSGENEDVSRDHPNDAAPEEVHPRRGNTLNVQQPTRDHRKTGERQSEAHPERRPCEGRTNRANNTIVRYQNTCVVGNTKPFRVCTNESANWGVE